MISPFHLYVGLMYAALALMAGWTFRASGAPLWAKLAMPVLLVALAGGTSLVQYQSRDMPVEATWDDLPGKCFDIAAFVPITDEIVHVWFVDSGRIYRLPVPDAATTLLLNDVRRNLADGESFVRVCRDATGEGSNKDILPDESGNQRRNTGRSLGHMHIDPRLFRRNTKSEQGA
jgi:hypothetical protein